MGSGGGQTSSKGSSQPTIPKWLLPYYKGAAGQLIGAQGNMPDLSQLYGNVPLLGVPGVTPEMSSLIGQFQQNVGLNPNEMQSASALQQFLPGTGGGMSPALGAAEQKFKDITSPEILGQASLMGLGNSGAGLQALTQGQESAFIPLIEQGTQNELAAAGQLGQLGLAEASQTQQQLQDALTAAGIPYDIAAQQAKALYDQQQQKFQFASNIQSGGASGAFSNLLGQNSTEIGKTSQPKF